MAAMRYSDEEDNPYWGHAIESQLGPDTPPPTAPAPTNNGSSGSNNSRDDALEKVRGIYQDALGRAPTAAELASEDENLKKYGLNTGPYGGIEAQIRARATNTPNSGQATAQYSGGGSGNGGGGGDANLASMFDYLKQRDVASQAERAQLHGILMQQLNGLTGPLSADSPGIKDVLGAERNASQRGAERNRAMLAEKMASEGLGDSGAFNAKAEGISQQRGEADAQFEGQTMYAELNNRRRAIEGLLSQAMSSGDAESARLLAGQLETIKTQLSQSNFIDQMGFNYNSLNANQNSGGFDSLIRLLTEGR